MTGKGVPVDWSALGCPCLCLEGLTWICTTDRLKLFHCMSHAGLFTFSTYQPYNPLFLKICSTNALCNVGSHVSGESLVVFFSILIRSLFLISWRWPSCAKLLFQDAGFDISSGICQLCVDVSGKKLTPKCRKRGRTNVDAIVNTYYKFADTDKMKMIMAFCVIADSRNTELKLHFIASADTKIAA